MEFVKWLVLVGFLVALVAAVLVAFGSVAEVGTSAVWDVQAAAKAPSLSTANTPVVRELMRNTFGYDQYVSGEWVGVIRVVFMFVMGMGALYLTFIIFRLARGILG